MRGPWRWKPARPIKTKRERPAILETVTFASQSCSAQANKSPSLFWGRSSFMLLGFEIGRCVVGRHVVGVPPFKPCGNFYFRGWDVLWGANIIFKMLYKIKIMIYKIAWFMMVHFGIYEDNHVWLSTVFGVHIYGWNITWEPRASEAISCTVWLQDCWSLFRSCVVSVGKNTCAQSDSESHRVVWGNARWNRRPRLCPGN